MPNKIAMWHMILHSMQLVTINKMMNTDIIMKINDLTAGLKRPKQL